VKPNSEPGERYWSLVATVCEEISIYDGPDEFLRQFRAAPTTAALLFAGHWCQSEVCNGGFDQFFGNSTGVLAPEALAAYRAMELTEWADTLAEAMRFFGEPYPRERKARNEMLSVGTKGDRRRRFSHLDDRFYEWLGGEPDRWDRAADQFAMPK
jgi:Domain of unknown function (DUF4375)